MARYDTIRIDGRGLDAGQQRLDAMPAKMVTAIRLALNTIGRRTRTIAWREIREEINLKPSYIRNEVNFIPARDETLYVVIYARRKGVTLSQFPHQVIWKKGRSGRRVRAGVRVSIGKGTTELVQGAFIAPIGPAGGLIVERMSKPRLPIDVLHGPSPSQVMDTKLDDIGGQSGRLLRPEVERQLKRANL